MGKIIKKNGYVYDVENYWQKGFETFHLMGKDPDSEMWKEEINQINNKLNNKEGYSGE